MGPLVSVVIPTYNRDDLVRKAIDSVLAQTHRDYEIVVIDDGSTDRTRDRLGEYGEAVRYFYQQRRGISAARNAGIERSRGDLIALLDSDDYWIPEKLERQVALFGEHPEYGLVASACGSIEQDGTFRERGRTGRSGWVLEDLFARNYIRTSSVVVRKACIEKVGGFDESLEECEDYDLFLRVAAEYPIGFIDDPLAVYLDNPAGVSTDSLKGRLYRLKVLEKGYLKERIPEGPYRRRIAYIAFRIGRHYVERGRRKEGRAYLRQALSLRPFNLKYALSLGWVALR